MGILYAIVLQLTHWVYSVYLFFHAFWERRQRRAPISLLAARTRLPKHLALVLVVPPSLPKDSTKAAVVDSIANLTSWCRQVGVSKLTVYEEHGLLTECEDTIRSKIAPHGAECDSSESETEYHPLTPPPSDYSESRPLSPSHSPTLIPITTIQVSNSRRLGKGSSKKQGVTRRRAADDDKDWSNPLQLCLISRDASKPAVAAVATSLAQKIGFKNRKGTRSNRTADYALSVNELEAILEHEDGLSPPDFMIVHSLGSENTSKRAPLELHGFPPWHIRLTEIFTSQVYDPWFSDPCVHPLTETILCEALDEFAGAEMRFGK